jgi:glycosyltransferase involved in cell wall biosynthesis
MKNNKIFWFYPHLKFWMGGTVHLYEQLSEMRNGHNLDIYLIVNKGDREIISKFKKAKIKVFNLDTFCTNDALYWLFFPFFLIKDLISSYLILNKFKKENNKILFATLFPSNFVAYVMSLVFKLDYYFYCYEPFPFFHDKEYIKRQRISRRLILKTLSFLYSWMDKLAVRNARKIFTSNNIKRRTIRHIYNCNSVVTYLGIDTNFFKKISQKENFLFEKYKDGVLIYHSTDYTPTKNTDLAIKIFEKVSKKYSKSKLLISSTQPDNPNKKNYIDLVKKLGLENKVIFLDLIPREHLPCYYSASVCYLFTATLDIHSTSLPNLEAMACETPVIRPKLKNKDDNEFKDGEAGFLVDIYDFQQVAKKIIYLIENPKLRIKMGKMGRKIVLDRFTWKNVVEKILNNIYV